MHKLQLVCMRAEASNRPVRRIPVPELPFGPNWVPPDFWRDKVPGKRSGVPEQPAIPLELPLEEPPMHRRAPQPEETPQRGVVILQM
ncbi:hypothetical protein J4450_01875 [Candidatus Micrarchaeota archaeon]|nr:hypothetical protein [Candidatus Micrarchaeota archaeon]